MKAMAPSMDGASAPQTTDAARVERVSQRTKFMLGDK
jgi:hypothetical protein